MVSRSPATHRVFEIAAEMSGALDAPAVDLQLLLRAVLECGDPQITDMTAGFRDALDGV